MPDDRARLERIASGVVAELPDDFVGLWQIVGAVRRLFPDVDTARVRVLTMEVVERLLSERRARAGMPAADGRGFASWDLPAQQVLARIDQEWDALAREPDIGEIVWFDGPVGDALPDQDGAQATLPDLAAEEDRLLQQVDAIQGLIFDDKEPRLRVEGVVDAYGAVYRAYAGLIADTPQGDEALKRALFLQWIAFVEPTAFTGIGPLDRATQHDVLGALQRRLAGGRVDDELVWMLRWYDSITEWYFSDFPNFPVLRGFLRDKYPNIHLAGIFTRDALQDRGQMGMYWLDMLQEQERVQR